MLSEFVEIFMNNKEDLRKSFIEKHPESYKEVVYAVVKLLNEKFDRYEKPSLELIHEIDDYMTLCLHLIQQMKEV